MSVKIFTWILTFASKCLRKFASPIYVLRQYVDTISTSVWPWRIAKPEGSKIFCYTSSVTPTTNFHLTDLRCFNWLIFNLSKLIFRFAETLRATNISRFKSVTFQLNYSLQDEGEITKSCMAWLLKAGFRWPRVRAKFEFRYASFKSKFTLFHFMSNLMTGCYKRIEKTIRENAFEQKKKEPYSD